MVTFAAIGAALAIIVGGAIAVVGGLMAMASLAPAIAAVILPYRRDRHRNSFRRCCGRNSGARRCMRPA